MMVSIEGAGAQPAYDVPEHHLFTLSGDGDRWILWAGNGDDDSRHLDKVISSPNSRPNIT